MSTFYLKLIALAAMLLDHIGAVLNVSRLFPMGLFPFVLRTIGRMAFPLYAFLIAEGSRHTKDMKKYMGRLLLFALISEMPYDYLFANLGKYNKEFVTYLEFQGQNVFFTLFLGAFCIYIYQQLKLNSRISVGMKQTISLLVTLPVVFLAEWGNTDYGGLGVIMIYSIYVAGDLLLFIPEVKYRQIIPLVIFSYCLYPAHMGLDKSIFFLVCLAAAALVFFYNGKKGRDLKWLFYFAYPIHLMVLGILWFSLFKNVPIAG